MGERRQAAEGSIASVVLGILGGVLSLGLSLYSYSLGSLVGALGSAGPGAVITAKAFAVYIPLAAITGGSIARSRPGWGGCLMLTSAAAILLVFGFNFFTFIPLSLSAAGGLVALAAVMGSDGRGAERLPPDPAAVEAVAATGTERADSPWKGPTPSRAPIVDPPRREPAAEDRAPPPPTLLAKWQRERRLLYTACAVPLLGLLACGFFLWRDAIALDGLSARLELTRAGLATLGEDVVGNRIDDHKAVSDLNQRLRALTIPPDLSPRVEALEEAVRKVEGTVITLASGSRSVPGSGSGAGLQTPTPTTPATLPRTAPELPSAGIWEMNGSQIAINKSGSRIVATYAAPRPGLAQAGVTIGTELFVIDLAPNDSAAGIAYLHSGRCGAIAYRVSGAYDPERIAITLRGRAPRINQFCQTEGFVPLQFEPLSCRANRSPRTEAADGG